VIFCKTTNSLFATKAIAIAGLQGNACCNTLQHSAESETFSDVGNVTVESKVKPPPS